MGYNIFGATDCIGKKEKKTIQYVNNILDADF